MLDAVVAALEEKHGGGEAFFDALDDYLRGDEDAMLAIYKMIKDPERYSFILTGKFGQAFLNWAIRTSKPFNGYIVFPGGMRDGKQKNHEYCMFKDPNRWMVKACFIDDSYYSGKTRETCIARLSVPKTVETFVAYDGSLVQPDFLRSLYRYHQNDIG